MTHPHHRPRRSTAGLRPGLWVLGALPGLLLGCTDAVVVDDAAASFTDHEEASDFTPVPDAAGKAAGVAVRFDASRIVAEDFFLAADAADAATVQRFLEASPYGGRCFLADELLQGRPVAEIVVETAREIGINPVVLLARMQVEKSLISKQQRPSKHTLDFAFGCGCPDGDDCYETYRGLDKQIRCAAETLAALHDGSRDGTGQFRAGFARRTSDRVTVTPASHATAALYGYTPWVLPGRGGNWLVWNVTRRFALHLEALDLLSFPRSYDDEPWIGSPCATDVTCGFVIAGGPTGHCHEFFARTSGSTAGICVLPCEGYCPDRQGAAPTFCAQWDGAGLCLAQAGPLNQQCAALPGTIASSLDRHVGQSRAAAATARVCAPD